MRRAVFYLRVSTQDQTTANQERELRAVAERMGCHVVKVYKDHGISGAKGRDQRPAFDALCRTAARRQFDVVMAWSVDRLGRSLKDLVGFLSEVHALKIDLFLAPTRLGHDDAVRQGHVRHDGRVRRVRTVDDSRARPGRPRASESGGQDVWAPEDR
jgi:predicted site-specific integrase-resolvase